MKRPWPRCSSWRLRCACDDGENAGQASTGDSWACGRLRGADVHRDVGGSRPVVLGIPLPMWLVRIDYIFHSDAFVAIEAQLGADDAGSDHRPVVATFSLRK